MLHERGQLLLGRRVGGTGVVLVAAAAAVDDVLVAALPPRGLLVRELEDLLEVGQVEVLDDLGVVHEVPDGVLGVVRLHGRPVHGGKLEGGLDGAADRHVAAGVRTQPGRARGWRGRHRTAA